MLNCQSDIDFLAKVHCVRLAFDDIISSTHNRHYFKVTARQIVSSFLSSTDQVCMLISAPSSSLVSGQLPASKFNLVLYYTCMDDARDHHYQYKAVGKGRHRRSGETNLPAYILGDTLTRNRTSLIPRFFPFSVCSHNFYLCEMYL